VRSFFFQAEDGIRDFHVTGVQTCALPICPTFLTALRWEIPQVVSYALGVLALGLAAFGAYRLRNKVIVQTSTNVSLIVLGLVFAALAFTVLPGFQVVIPGASQVKDMIAFIVLIGVLMIRPIGLLGERLAVEERG